MTNDSLFTVSTNSLHYYCWRVTGGIDIMMSFATVTLTVSVSTIIVKQNHSRPSAQSRTIAECVSHQASKRETA